MENNTFTGNKAYRYGGGAISSTRFGDTINNCTFTDNFAQGYGGAVSADYPTITNSTFINNHANHGGAICTIIADVSDSKFYENSADDNWVVLAATKLIESNNIHPGQVALSMNHTTYLTMDYDVENEIAIMPGYYAYCMEEYADYPQYGVLWENLRYAQNSLSEERVGEYLKILILKYWNDETQHGNLQKLVNMFTDHEFKSSDNEIVQEIMSLYDSGYRVPTVNALRVYDNGTVAIFNFKEIITPSGTQNVFAFNITYNPNLTVKKEVITNPVINGKQVEFNITVKNEGKCNLTYAWINETSFSNGLIYSSFNSKFNWTYDKQAKIWTLNDTLTPNATANIILIFNVTKAGEMNNTVSVGIGNYTFKNDTVKFTVYAPKLAVEKLTLTKFVYIGNQTVFTIIIKNTGDYDLKDVFVVEKSYDGLKYNSYNGEKWIKQGDKYIYNDVLAKGKSASFNITFDTVKAGNFTNIVIAGSNITENQTANNTTTVYKPGLKVEKITLTQNVKIGSLTSFKIIVTNTGDCKLGSIFVYEKYDQGLIYYEFTGDKWSKKGDIFKYSGELNPGESASFTVFFNTTRVGEFTNSVIAGSNVTNNETTQNNTVVLENHTNPLNKSNNTILNKSSKNTILNKSEIPKKEIKTNIKNATGNPLMALFAVFLIVGGFGIRKRK
ncbi:MAG: hypothetical protein IJ258_04595 [Methanobrevibacter sp.]|uniref:hypothetical protein n=1 Tax=Methanobrevibacter sp. TaxID=66852 RepID=UPI0025D0C9B3|nr:hypothetical protein [Methanobrevibacter sp.]MBQ8017368.1 hypothetical protein [Methanobrevibacter sp.]